MILSHQIVFFQFCVALLAFPVTLQDATCIVCFKGIFNYHFAELEQVLLQRREEAELQVSDFVHLVIFQLSCP